MLPFFWILPRYGIPKGFAVLCAFPFFAYLAIWLVALGKTTDQREIGGEL